MRSLFDTKELATEVLETKKSKEMFGSTVSIMKNLEISLKELEAQRSKEVYDDMEKSLEVSVRRFSR